MTIGIGPLFDAGFLKAKEVCIDAIQQKINKLDEFQKKQSGFYLQYEDRGYTSTRIHVLQEAIRIINDC